MQLLAKVFGAVALTAAATPADAASLREKLRMWAGEYGWLETTVAQARSVLDVPPSATVGAAGRYDDPSSRPTYTNWRLRIDKPMRKELEDIHKDLAKLYVGARRTAYKGAMNWKGQPHGNGVEFFVTEEPDARTRKGNTYIYEGAFVNGKRNGRGTLYEVQLLESAIMRNPIIVDQTLFYGYYFYKGEWRNNEMHGEGMIGDPTLSEYKIRDGRLADERDDDNYLWNYDGMWENGKMHGAGKFARRETGKVWVNGFNKMHGVRPARNGWDFIPGGRINYEGIFKNGELSAEDVVGASRWARERYNQAWNKVRLAELKAVSNRKVWRVEALGTPIDVLVARRYRPLACLRSQSTSMKYSGGWHEGAMHGWGQLLAPNGNLIHRGEYENGTIKTDSASESVSEPLKNASAEFQALLSQNAGVSELIWTRFNRFD